MQQFYTVLSAHRDKCTPNLHYLFPPLPHPKSVLFKYTSSYQAVRIHYWPMVVTITVESHHQFVSAYDVGQGDHLVP